MGGELPFPEIFSNPEKLLGHRVVVNAVLVIRGGECYLVPSIDSHDAIQRIEVCAPGLEKKLDASVGGWVGGPASYFDTVNIVGTLQDGTTRRNPLAIINIESLALYRDEEIYAIHAALAKVFTERAINSGTNIPTIRQIGQSEELVRLVPIGDAAGRSSFYISRAQYDAITKSGLNAVQVAESLGLPATSFANGGYKGFQAFSISPQPGLQVVVYESKVAPIEQGRFTAQGAATQFIVPNLGSFTPPKPIPGGIIPALRRQP